MKTPDIDRRGFIDICTRASAGLGVLASFQALAAGPARPKEYPRALLVDERGDPIRASKLLAQTNYVFHYPFEATPVFLLDLGRPATPTSLSTRDRNAYAWPGGVGPKKSIVAYSAICAHQLVYPTRDVSFISYRPKRALRGVQDGLIHCCAEHSQYDPARGAEVLAGPASQPLCAILLAHDARKDTLTAHATLGGELFDEFFRKYEMKLSLEVGPKARTAVQGETVVRELDRFCRNTVRC